MKCIKRILITILLTVFAVCLSLTACKNIGGDSIKSPMENNSSPEGTPVDGIKSTPAKAPVDEDKITPRTNNAEKTDYSKMYGTAITEWKAALNRHVNDGYKGNDTFDFWFYDGYTDSIKTYYAFYDIDGNGIIELLLRKQNEYEDIIAYIFTIKDGEPINLFGYDDGGLPYEVPWSRYGSCEILDNGLIDCYYGDYTIYKIAEDGYSAIKFASSQPYDYPDEANKAEAKWRFYINGTEVDYDFYVQSLSEQWYAVIGNNTLADIDWNSLD